MQEDEVAPTKPKVKAFKGRHQPTKAKAINKTKGKDGNQEHPRRSLTDFITTKENKEGMACEDSIVRVFHSGNGRA
jgi:aspartate carbamoyltransferase catalytic subunit